MKRENGFTLVELLVVIAIIALLMGILMPALARVRQIAYRLICGTKISGIGKAMLVYSNDYDGELPRAGQPNSGWAPTIANWRNVSRSEAFPTRGGGTASITSNFFLLIKYAEVTSASFVCKGDSEVKKFELSDTDLANTGADIVDCWDFGPTPQSHCSYSYHMPFGKYALTVSGDPGMAVVGDPNPWLNSSGFPARADADWNNFDPDGDREKINWGNAQTHQMDGQNVLYLDGHVTAEKTSACGVNGDNVFTKWSTGVEPKRKGTRPVAGDMPADRADSLLMTDGQGG